MGDANLHSSVAAMAYRGIYRQLTSAGREPPEIPRLHSDLCTRIHNISKYVGLNGRCFGGYEHCARRVDHRVGVNPAG